MSTPLTSTIQIRPAAVGDSATLRRLAALDSHRPLRGRTLIAVQDGTALAAIAVEDGTVVANPFARTAELVELLEVHRRVGSAREDRMLHAAATPRAPLGLAA